MENYLDFNSVLNLIHKFILENDPVEEVPINKIKETNLEHKLIKNKPLEKPVKKESSESKKKSKVLDDIEDNSSDENKKVSDKRSNLKFIYTSHLEDELLLSNAYSQSGLDYETLFSYLGTNQIKENEDFYKKVQTMSWSNGDNDLIDNKEAEETMEQLCYAQMLGVNSDVDYMTRKKLSNWITFNPTLFKLFEARSLTSNVNYSEF